MQVYCWASMQVCSIGAGREVGRRGWRGQQQLEGIVMVVWLRGRVITLFWLCGPDCFGWKEEEEEEEEEERNPLPLTLHCH